MSQSSSPLTTTPSAADVRQPLSPVDMGAEPMVSTPAVPRELEIPAFAKNLSKPLSLKEDLSQVPRKHVPISKSHIPSSFEEDTDSPDKYMHVEGVYYTVRNISSRFTETSLGRFLGSSDVGFLRFKILSVYEQKGRFEPPLVPQQIVSIPGTAIVKTRSGVTHMIAYAEKSEFEPFNSGDDVHAFVIRTIFDHLASRFVPATADQATVSSGAPKFGGGLGRKSAGVQPARYMIRSRVGLLSDEEWKQRGAVTVDSDSEWTVAKFPRIELRDTACDSFIVGIELGTRANKRFEVGLSVIANTMVFIENMEQPCDGVPPLRKMSPDIFFLNNV